VQSTDEVIVMDKRQEKVQSDFKVTRYLVVFGCDASLEGAQSVRREL
jgi:hypothetical protein